MAEKLQTNQSINQFTFIKQKSLIYSTHLQGKTSKRDVRSLASSLTTVMLTFHSTIQLRSQKSFESGSTDLLDLNYLPSRWWNEINTARWIVGGMLTFMTSLRHNVVRSLFTIVQFPLTKTVLVSSVLHVTGKPSQ